MQFSLFASLKVWILSVSFHFLQTPWLWNTKECWYNYPYQVHVYAALLKRHNHSLSNIVLKYLLCVCTQPLTVDIHYYYILELSFYLSLLFSKFTDIRRKVRVTARHTIMNLIHFQSHVYAIERRVIIEKIPSSLFGCPSPPRRRNV